MRRHHRPIPFPGPIPPGMMRISADIPTSRPPHERIRPRANDRTTIALHPDLHYGLLC
jgi:hypothetical protein